jgi:hypothetical protein
VKRFVRIAGTVLLALAMSSAMSGAWAQPGKANGRAARDQDTRQSVQRNGDADRRGSELSKEDRERLRRDIREYGNDVYRDRDRNHDRNRKDDSRARRPERERSRR